MMNVPLSGPSYLYGDNMPVIHYTLPDSTLKKKKKSNSIFYHAVRKSVAMENEHYLADTASNSDIR
jgi:hypothetical protein